MSKSTHFISSKSYSQATFCGIDLIGGSGMLLSDKPSEFASSESPCAICAELLEKDNSDLPVKLPPLKFKNVARALRSIGMTIRKSDGEYRVNKKGGPEDTAYYTNDLKDAAGTGYLMSLGMTKIT